MFNPRIWTVTDNDFMKNKKKKKKAKKNPEKKRP